MFFSNWYYIFKNCKFFMFPSINCIHSKDGKFSEISEYCCPWFCFDKIQVWKQQTKLICFDCKNTFDKEKDVIDHITLPGCKEFKCDVCDKKFSLRHNLLQHIREINELREEFKCPHCGRKYTIISVIWQNTWSHAKNQILNKSFFKIFFIVIFFK